MASARWLGAALVVCAIGPGVLGCDSPGVRLTVRVQSGLRAEHELRHVRVRVLEGSVPCDSEGERTSAGRSIQAVEQESLRAGTLTVAEAAGLPRGIYTVHVLARRPGEGGPESGAVLIERCAVTTLTNDRVLRVPLTTDCINVTCPAPGGSPEFTECLAGRCVDPRCDPDDPSSAELCCDRAVLGDACDSDPTLCRDPRDCAPTLDCAGSPPSCEDGVCIEPLEDACDPGQYCDATTQSCTSIGEPPADAGVRDAGIDASAEPIDAFVALDIDAPFLDAPSPDAWAPDAHEALDAFALDSPAPRDAPSAADAGRPGEDCTLVGDEDGDSAADCADSECATSSICTVGCPLIGTSPAIPSEPGVPPPAHWYRADRGVVRMSSTVCAIRDLVGSAHFVAVPSTRPIAGRMPILESLAGQPAISLNVGSGDARMIAASDLGLDADGDYTVVVVASAGITTGTFLQTWAPTSMTELFELEFLEVGGTWTHGLKVHGSWYTADGTSATQHSIEMVRVSALAPGAMLRPSIDVLYDRDGSRRPITLASGTGVADMHVFTGPTQAVIGPGNGLRIAEILVYSRALTGPEGSAVLAYLGVRYP